MQFVTISRRRAEQFLDVGSHRIVLDLRAGVNQGFDDGHIVDCRVTVLGAPQRLTQRRPAVLISGFERGAALKKQFDDVQSPADDGPMQTGRFGDISLLQEEVDDVVASILTSPLEAQVHLFVRRVEGWKQVDAAHARGPFKIQVAPRAARNSAACPRPLRRAASSGFDPTAAPLMSAPDSSRVSISANCTPARCGWMLEATRLSVVLMP